MFLKYASIFADCVFLWFMWFYVVFVCIRLGRGFVWFYAVLCGFRLLRPAWCGFLWFSFASSGLAVDVPSFREIRTSFVGCDCFCGFI